MHPLSCGVFLCQNINIVRSPETILPAACWPTRHLIQIGRERIAFLGGPPEDSEVGQRFKGYETALEEAGRSVDPERVAYGDYSHTSGFTVMQQLLKQSPDLDAVFVNSDLMAIGAINVIQNVGKRVPEDIAVIGYDDLSLANYNNLPLTTVRQNIPLAGQNCWLRTLFNILRPVWLRM